MSKARCVGIISSVAVSAAAVGLLLVILGGFGAVAQAAPQAAAVLQPSLSITKTVEATPGGPLGTLDAPPGGVVVYTVEIANHGDVDALGVEITDTLPPEVGFGGWVAQGSALLPPPGDTIVWGPYTISADMSYSFVYTATVEAGTAFLEVTNSACFTSTNAGSGCDDATFTIQEVRHIYLPLVMRFFATLITP